MEGSSSRPGEATHFTHRTEVQMDQQGREVSRDRETQGQ